jgi:hypothetical protein
MDVIEREAMMETLAAIVVAVVLVSLIFLGIIAGLVLIVVVLSFL